MPETPDVEPLRQAFAARAQRIEDLRRLLDAAERKNQAMRQELAGWKDRHREGGP